MTDRPSWLKPTEEEQAALDRMSLVIKLRGDSYGRVLYKPLRDIKCHWTMKRWHAAAKTNTQDWAGRRSTRPWHYRRSRSSVKIFGSLESLEEYVNSLT